MGLVQTLARFARPAPPPAPNAAEVLQRANALSEAGRSREALALAGEHASRLDDAALWAAMGRLRLAAAGELTERAAPRPDWPPDLPDPFPDCRGIPEVSAKDLSWPVLGGAVLHHGSLLVRGLLDSPTSARLRDGIDDALAGYDAFHAPAGPAGAAISTSPGVGAYTLLHLPATEPLEATRPWSRDSGGVWAVESPRLFQRVLDIYRARGVIAALAGYLGEEPLLSVGKTVFRRAEPDGHGLFHQDGAFMGAGIRTVNVWTTLSDCGEDAPGLEVVARRIPRIVPTGTPGAIFDWAVARDEAERAADGAPIVFPSFKAGDALVFDQFMLHATGVKPGMTKRRYAVESWFFAPSAYAADQVPIAI